MNEHLYDENDLVLTGMNGETVGELPENPETFKEEIAPYVNIIYGVSPAHTPLLKSLQIGGVLEQLQVAADLIRNESSGAYSQMISGRQDVVYERDDLIKDCRSTIDTLNEVIRALIRDKNALYDIIGDLELEKLKAADAPR